MMGATTNIRTERLFPIIATFWVLVVLDSIIIWNPLERALRVLAFLSVVLASFFFNRENRKGYLRRSYSILLFCSIYITWLTFAMSDTINLFLSHIVKFVPLLFLIFWPKHLLYDSYRYIRIVVIFFAIGGSIISILTLTGYITHIPYYVLPPRETLHIKLGFEYHVYGIIPALYDPISSQAPRVCGMMKEPGHFAIILGFIYLIDRFREKTINLWIVLAGLLTFSSNFFLIVAITELRYIFTLQAFKKLLKFSAYGGLFLCVYFVLPSEIKGKVNYLFYERNLAEVIEALDTSSSINEGLDERANKHSVSIYENISYREFLTGGVEFDSADSLADYRGLILRIGMIGIVLSFIAYLSTMKSTITSLQISLLLLFVLILLHRSWMLQSPYLYFLSFLSVVVYSYDKERSSFVSL